MRTLVMKLSVCSHRKLTLLLYHHIPTMQSVWVVLLPLLLQYILLSLCNGIRKSSWSTMAIDSLRPIHQTLQRIIRLECGRVKSLSRLEENYLITLCSLMLSLMMLIHRTKIDTAQIRQSSRLVELSMSLLLASIAQWHIADCIVLQMNTRDITLLLMKDMEQMKLRKYHLKTNI